MNFLIQQISPADNSRTQLGGFLGFLEICFDQTGGSRDSNQPSFFVGSISQTGIYHFVSDFFKI